MLKEMTKEALAFRRARVCDLLGWMPGRYVMFLYKTGHRYATLLYGSSPYKLRLCSSIVFWEWWKSRWDERDREFLELVDGLEDSIPMDERMELYQSYHDAAVLSEEIRPAAIASQNVLK